MSGFIHDISCTLLKGTALHHPETVQLGHTGIGVDRLFHIVRADGVQVRTGPRTLVIRGEYDEEREHLSITLPDGRCAAARVQLGPELLVEVSWDRERPVPSREVIGPFAELLSEHLGKPTRLAKAHRDTRAVDVEPITLVSLASVSRAERQLGGQALGAERFRMNLILDGIGEHEEDRWYGRRLSIGDATLRVTGPVPRCAVTTYDPDTGVRDAATLKAILQYRPAIELPGCEPVRAPFGVYAQVERSGAVRCGDRLIVR